MPQKLQKNISLFFSAIADCMALSWRTSRFYTVLRLLCCLTPPLLTLAAAVLGKYILDANSVPADFCRRAPSHQHHALFTAKGTALCPDGAW